MGNPDFKPARASASGTEPPNAGLSASLVAAAVATGRLPGEPASVLQPGARRSILARLFSSHVKCPLADPRLEVLRAISASLSNGEAHISRDHAAAAYRVGWTPDDLGNVFPGARLEQASV